MNRAISLAILLLFTVLPIAALLAGCTRIEVTPAGVPVPSIKAGQLGGQLTVQDGATQIWVNNEQSFEEGVKTARRLVASIIAGQALGEWLDNQAADNAAEAATAQAKIAADTEAQRIAAEQAVQLQQLENAAAEAALNAAP